MSNERQEIKHQISDGEIITSPINLGFGEHHLAIVFYTDNTYSTVISKSQLTGSVCFRGSETGEEYTLMQDGFLRLGVDDNYNRPVARGHYRYFKATFNAISGSNHCKLISTSIGL